MTSASSSDDKSKLKLLNDNLPIVDRVDFGDELLAMFTYMRACRRRLAKVLKDYDCMRQFELSGRVNNKQMSATSADVNLEFRTYQYLSECVELLDSHRLFANLEDDWHAEMHQEEIVSILIEEDSVEDKSSADVNKQDMP